MKKSSGFTLLECVIGLLVVLMMTYLVVLTVPCLKRSSDTAAGIDTDWYLCLQRLESPQYAFSVQKVTHQRLILLNQVNHETYIVQGGRQSIFLKTAQGGYLPLLVNCSPGSLRFDQIDSQNVRIECQLKNGERKNALLNFAEEG
ncbi:ComGF family competence protein [Limosilactobacillus caecicola]|uniref:ComGF family competence protein n=1 Tax=Limosilactobacillus caecicola TaxID=2941332 RepID=UPI0020405146|nr:ComGF family competence protein [Limosilactobacillus caecicola]